MRPAQFSVTLRLRHPEIDPAEISRRLGIEPQHTWRAGDPRRLESGEIGEGVYRETYWVGLLPLAQTIEMLSGRRDPHAVGTPPLEEAAAQGALFLTLLKMKRSAAFWKVFAEQGGSVHCLLQVHCRDRFQFEMSPALLAICVELKVSLSIDVDTAARAVAA
jgi:uncharacterized protein DUF4279